MTINTVNYADNRFQNLRTGVQKKNEQEVSSEVGKIQESSVSASLDQINTGKEGIAVTEVSRQQGAEQTGSQGPSGSPRFDTVEISAEGKAISAQLQTQKAEESAAQEYQYEDEDLSDYTDTELKQMYYRGEISLQEYESETGEAIE